MTETSTEEPQTVEDGGSLEQVHVPAWEAKYKLSENPEELAHLVCCRDLDWRQAICGYIEEEPTLMYEADNICTMCIETAESMGSVMGSRRCPIDNQECPPEDEVDRMIAERASRT
ncbi:hypothetical protein M1D88_07825 [Arthrobacter sp. R1-13]